MKALSRELSTGKIKVLIYKKDDIKSMTYIKGLIKDIYNNAEDFNGKITWIQDIKPFENYNIEDVLKEYIENYIQNKTLFFIQAGILSGITGYPTVEDAKSIIKTEKQIFLKNGFLNIIWKRCMRNTFGNSDICLYQNEGGKSFVENYKDLLIDRTIDIEKLASDSNNQKGESK